MKLKKSKIKGVIFVVIGDAVDLREEDEVDNQP